jgi:hypothetical protein
MDQRTIKRPSPKCRFYWYLIEFIERRYSQSSPLVNQRPSNLLTGSPTPPPPLCSTGLCTHTVYNRGGEGIGLCGEHTGVILYVFDKIPNLLNCFTTPNKNLGVDGGLRQIITSRQVPLI